MMLNGLAIPENPESLIMPGFEQSSAKAGGSGVDLFLTAPPFVHAITCLRQIFAKRLQAVQHHSAH